MVQIGRAAEAAAHPDHRRHPRRRPRRLERLEGAAPAHALLRDRAGADRRLLPRSTAPQRIAAGAGRVPRRASPTGRSRSSTPISPATIRPTGSRSICRARSAMRASSRASEQAGTQARDNVGFDEARGVTELTILAPDHPRLLSIIAGACASAGANIVDAQIFTTTDGLRARHHRDLARIRPRRGRGAARRRGSARRSRRRSKASCACRSWRSARPAEAAGSSRSWSSPKSTIDNHWSNRYTVIEVSGLDRPGLLYELTTRDLEAQPQHRLGPYRDLRRARARRVLRHRPARRPDHRPTRQAAIKRALVHLLAGNGATAKPAA